MTRRGRAQSASLRYNTGGELEQDAVYCHTHIHDSQLPLSDYERVNAEAFNAHSAITASSASTSDEGPALVNMAGKFRRIGDQLEAYACLQAQQQEEIFEQKQTIKILHAMMMQLLKNAKEKKSSRQGKKKQFSTPSMSSEEEMNAIHVEISSKHTEPLDSRDGGSQRINELERCLDVVVNRDKLQDVSRD